MKGPVLLQKSGQPNSEFTALGSEEIQLGIQWQEGHCSIQPLLLADVFGTGMKPVSVLCVPCCCCE